MEVLLEWFYMAFQVPHSLAGLFAITCSLLKSHPRPRGQSLDSESPKRGDDRREINSHRAGGESRKPS